MAVTLVNASNNYNEYIALSTDNQPVDAPENSLLLEIDSGDIYYYCNNEWKLFGSSSQNAMGNVDVDPTPIDLGG